MLQINELIFASIAIIAIGAYTGKNNKGSVDMWRRQKIAFSVVRDLFRQPI